MPQFKEFNLTGAQLRIGDRVLADDGAFDVTRTIATTPVRKTRYVYADVEPTAKETARGTQPGTKRFEVDREYRVVRSVPTDDEINADRHARALDSFTDMSRKAVARFAAAKDKLFERLNSPQGAASYDYAAVLNAAATVKIWDWVIGYMTSVNGNDEKDDIDLVDAVRYVRDRIVEDFTEGTCGGWMRGESRSTSAMSNLMEDVDREATASFLSDVRWRLADY